MRNKGSKDKHGRYSSVKQMQSRAVRLADAIMKFNEQAQRQHSIRPLTDFNKLVETEDHLRELAALRVE